MNPNCLGCGRYHGSVNVHRLCLERHLLKARSELAPLLVMRQVVRAQTTSWNVKNQRAQTGG